MSAPRTSRLSVAIVGPGTWARVHLDAVRATRRGRVVVLIGRDADGTARAASELGVPDHTTNVSEAFGRADIDVVHVCTPPDSHAPLVHAAIRAGKHVVVEKPLAPRASDALAMATSAAAAGLHGMTAFTYRGLRSMERARDIVATGAVGDVRIVDGRYLQQWLLVATPGWRTDPDVVGWAPVVADIGVHWFDAVEYITGRRVAALCAALGDQGRVAGAPPDTASIHFRLDNGAMGSVLLSQVYPGHANTIVVALAGNVASLTWHRDRSEPVVCQASGDGIAGFPSGREDESREETAESALTTLFDRFYEAVWSGSEPPILGAGAEYPTLWDGHRASLIVDAVVESAGHGQWVPINEEGQIAHAADVSVPGGQ